MTAVAEIYQVSRSSILDKKEPTMELLYEGSVIAVESHQFFILDVRGILPLEHRSTSRARRLFTTSRGGGTASACPFVSTYPTNSSVECNGCLF